MNSDYYLDLVEDGVRNIKIKGRKEKHRAFKKACLDHAPFTGQVEVPHDLHGFIIGRKGSEVRSLMKQYDVNISIPDKNDRSDVITIKGPTEAKVEQAKAGLLRKIELVEREKKDRLLRSFRLTVDVDPQHIPKIIGRAGVTVKKIRQDHNVTINFPKRHERTIGRAGVTVKKIRQDHNVKINFPERHERTITIIGREKDAKDARYAILKLVQQQETMYKEKVQIDPGIYSRIIGHRGRNISKIIEQYKVEITFPSTSDSEPDLIIIQGTEENVLKVKDYLINLEEEYLQDSKQRDLMQHTKLSSKNGTYEKDGNGATDKNKATAAPDTSNTP